MKRGVSRAFGASLLLHAAILGLLWKPRPPAISDGETTLLPIEIDVSETPSVAELTSGRAATEDPPAAPPRRTSKRHNRPAARASSTPPASETPPAAPGARVGDRPSSPSTAEKLSIFGRRERPALQLPPLLPFPSPVPLPDEGSFDPNNVPSLPKTLEGESGVVARVHDDGRVDFTPPAAVSAKGLGLAFDLNDAVARMTGGDPYR